MSQSYVEKTNQETFNIMNLSYEEINLIHDTIQFISLCEPVHIYGIENEGKDSEVKYDFKFSEKHHKITELYKKIEIECPGLICNIRVKETLTHLHEKTNDISDPSGADLQSAPQKPENYIETPGVNHIKPLLFNTQRKIT